MHDQIKERCIGKGQAPSNRGKQQLQLGAHQLQLGALQLQLGARQLQLGTLQIQLGALRLQLGAQEHQLRARQLRSVTDAPPKTSAIPPDHLRQLSYLHPHHQAESHIPTYCQTRCHRLIKDSTRGSTRNSGGASWGMIRRGR